VNALQGLVVAIRLARREMRVGLRGFGVFLACLFLGVFAVGAVGSFSRAVRAGLQADARSLLGGDAEISLPYRELTAEELGFLRDRGRVSRVEELRAMASSVGTEPTNRVLAEVKAVDSAYPLYGQVALDPAQPLAEALASRRGTFGAAVEETALLRLGVGVGGRFRLGQVQYQVRAVIRFEPDRSIRAFTLGPRILVSGQSLEATGLLEPGSLVTNRYRLRLPGAADGDAVRAALAEMDLRFPGAGWRTRSFENAAGRVRYFLERMTANLTLLGLASLLVGGLGVAGAVRGYLGGRIQHIAAMKCLGVPAGVLFAAYLLQVLTLGALGAGLGVLAGAGAPFAAGWLAGGALPVPLRPGIFPGPLAAAAGFGLLIALAFSIAPLDAARRVSPAILFRGYAGAPLRPGRRASWAVVGCAALLVALAVVVSGAPRLAAWFTVGVAGCFLVFRVLADAVVLAARKLPRPADPRLRLGLANLHRPGAPTRSAVFSLGLGLTALVAVALVQADLGVLVDENIPAEAPSYFFIDVLPDQVAAFDEAVQSVPGVTRVDRVPTLRGRITRISGVPSEQAQISPEVSWAVRGDRYLTYSDRPPEGSVISAGSWWPADYHGPPLLSLAADLGQGFGVGPGDTLTVSVLGREITARIANLRDVDWSTLALNFALVFSPGVLEGAPQTYLAAVYVPADREEAVFRAVTDRFPNVSAVRVKEVLENVSRVLSRIGIAFRAMGSVAVLAGFLVLAGALSADQHRRLRDAVVFKVCGATRRDLLTAFATEFALLGVAAGAVSAVTGTIAAWAVVTWVMKAPFSFRPMAVLLTVGAGVGLTLALGLLGTARVLSRKPAPYLRNG
jgi:putative ABC transport system permease protein